MANLTECYPCAGTGVEDAGGWPCSNCDGQGYKVVLESYDDEEEEEERYDDEREESMDDPCCFPGQCCMPDPHFPSECHTAEMLEAQASSKDEYYA